MAQRPRPELRAAHTRDDQEARARRGRAARSYVIAAVERLDLTALRVLQRLARRAPRTRKP
jgi:hypothetical protein